MLTDTDTRRRSHDPSILLLLENGPHRFRTLQNVQVARYINDSEMKAKKKEGGDKQTLNVPLKCTAITASHSASDMAVKDLSRKIPALATRICTPPKASSAALMIASPSSAEQTAAVAFPPAIV